jgi:hypothetical protein
MSEPWFTGDKDGLAKIARRRGLAFVLFELVQNCWDTEAKKVTVDFVPVPSSPFVNMTVEDDHPDGFSNLSHAWTLYAQSEKRGQAEKRGFLNLGEKLVLAICDDAVVSSTTGTVTFNKDGRSVSRKKREAGTVFSARIRMKREELKEIEDAAKLLLPPPGVQTWFNGKLLEPREPLRTFEAALPTLHLDGEGMLRPTRRKTTVRTYPKVDGVAYLYEMGLPVVEIELPWSVEVAQKALVNADRDNVTPAYKKEVCVLVVNAMHDYLTKEDAAIPIITEALADERLGKDAQEAVMTLQWGKDRAIACPTDPEATQRLQAQGYNVIPGGVLPKGASKLLRENGILQTTHEISPTYKPYSDDPDAKPAVLIPESEWTAGMQNIAAYAKWLAWQLIDRTIDVRFEKNRFKDPWAANYGGRELTFNHTKLGKSWFDHGPTISVNALLIHEFAHEKVSNHLDERFFREVQTLGAKMTELALSRPEVFVKYGWKKA